jgi:hypothetical protein
VVWNEAVKTSGAGPDFHRRDLWDAITSGRFPEWELGLQPGSAGRSDAGVQPGRARAQRAAAIRASSGTKYLASTVPTPEARS